MCCRKFISVLLPLPESLLLDASLSAEDVLLVLPPRALTRLWNAVFRSLVALSLEPLASACIRPPMAPPP